MMKFSHSLFICARCCLPFLSPRLHRIAGEISQRGQLSEDIFHFKWHIGQPIIDKWGTSLLPDDEFISPPPPPPKKMVRLGWVC